MKKNNNNGWKNFSRGIAVTVLIAATICGFCGLGATFAQIPWFIIAGLICFVLIVVTISWFLGYNSRQVQPAEQPADKPAEAPVQQPAEQIIILRKELTPEEFNRAYNMFSSEEDEEEPEETVENL